MFELPFTKAHEQALREQAITADTPGTVLRDFQTLLDYVGSEGVPAAGKHNLLPIEAIGVLNPRLSRPLLLGEMKRPMLQSHPYLQALHLLLRASGVGRIDGTAGRARLVVDATTRERWQLLNPTEKYFTLLEAGLLFGCASMVGDRPSGSGGLLPACLRAWQSPRASSERFNMTRPEHIYVDGCYGAWFNLALLDLFGLMKVIHANTPIKPWRPAGLTHLPWGDALFTLLANWWWSGEARAVFRAAEAEAAGAEPRFGVLQPLLQPYFAEWQTSLEPEPSVSRAGTFVFRVALGSTWRRLALPAKAMLAELLDLVLRSVNFDDEHLHAFYTRNRFGAALCISDPRTDEGPWSDQVRVGELALQPGEKMLLVYDFGDDWRFDIKLERIDPPSRKTKAPAILAKSGASPRQYARW